MVVTVIKFPKQTQSTSDGTAEPKLHETLRVALEIHHMIVSGACSDVAYEHPDAIVNLLQVMLARTYGADAVHWAEVQFEAVYAASPYVFLDHVLSFRD
jgi:hypothetical protein